MRVVEKARNMLNRTSAKRWTRRAALFAACGACVLTVSGFSAPDPAAASQSPDLVFSNYGRIVSIQADGSNRTVLTRENARIGRRFAGDEILLEGDSKPVVSHDGSRLAFARDSENSNGFRTQVMVADRDGSNQVSVASYTREFLQNLQWTEGGRLLISTIEDVEENGQGFSDFTYFTLDTNGGDKQVLMRIRYPLADFGLSEEFVSYYGLTPKGKVLYGYSNFETKAQELRIHDLITEDDQLVARGAADAAFSPDGTKVVFSTFPCELLEMCGDPSLPKPGLWTAEADGTNAKRLVAGPGDITKPGYSEDGKTIVFASTRNFPSGGDSSNEIYSVGTDGSCLMWLTNGSPASIDPSFTPGSGSASPGSCAPNHRKPLVEMRPLPARKVDTRPRLWAGTEVGGRLLSSVAYEIPGAKWESYSYGDCGFFAPSKCRRPMLIESGPVCGAAFGPTLGITDIGPNWYPRKARESLFISSRQRGGSLGASIFFSGAANLFIGDDVLGGRSGKPNTLRDHLLMVRSLRKVGSGNPGVLPGPIVRRQWKRAARRMSVLVSKTGSVKKAARKLRTSINEARLSLRIGSTLAKIKDLRTTSCRKTDRSALFELDPAFSTRSLDRSEPNSSDPRRSPLWRPWDRD
jgi:hypothetical protein